MSACISRLSLCNIQTSHGSLILYSYLNFTSMNKATPKDSPCSLLYIYRDSYRLYGQNLLVLNASLTLLSCLEYMIRSMSDEQRLKYSKASSRSSRVGAGVMATSLVSISGKFVGTTRQFNTLSHILCGRTEWTASHKRMSLFDTVNDSIFFPRLAMDHIILDQTQDVRGPTGKTFPS